MKLFAAVIAALAAALVAADGPGTCTMELNTNFPMQGVKADCDAIKPCFDKVTIAPISGQSGFANVTMSGADCIPGNGMAGYMDTQGVKTVSVNTKAGIVTLFGSADVNKGMVSANLIDTSNPQTPKCSAALDVTSGVCLDSDKGPTPSAAHSTVASVAGVAAAAVAGAAALML